MRPVAEGRLIGTEHIFGLCAALRIMEVRAAYCKDDFEWHMMQSLANKDMGNANVALLRSNAEKSFKRASSSKQQDAES